ncbi:HAD-IIB family hydrolase [Nitrosospira sp. NRS527]|uniref:HAD-IIB family hydrolase n=1 Tax=Nitrosospira sp. NRS527 TaxID=155925 RepID=UPI001AF058D2|nr:HAD-IIB family hydrolase [Nitrosospira sp. NRS527]BCT68820.1 D-inositol-3-phosphate glycosyltransferase [Nitrosospira sp. NRS527]
MKDLYILMLSLHGLIRGNDLELGRDADTGGQVLYVVELARALARQHEVVKVDLLTRRIEDSSVSADYARPEEMLGDNARIIRLPCGPRRYLRKESLWPYLDQLVDRALLFLREQKRLPDVIHSHYADAGYVGMQLSQLLGIPQIHTGHSLGRSKQQRLLAQGRKPQALERQFSFHRRISTEEAILQHASLIITSTPQESDEQYGLYTNYHRERAVIVPPGTDISRFSPPSRRIAPEPEAARLIDRFLTHPRKPLVLTICRPEMRKNLGALIAAFGSSPKLHEHTNLAIIAGNRDDIRKLDVAQIEVMTNLLLDIDLYDLWGKVALPKQHKPADIAGFYRLAARRRGIFVNPALTEPFGLTLIEAAASGLPIVATEDGGPRDIVAHCKNGVLVNPMDINAIAEAIEYGLADSTRWRRWSRNGIAGVRNYYTWDAHVRKYLRVLFRLLHQERKQIRRTMAIYQRPQRHPLPLISHMLISDIDNTLLGDRAALRRFLTILRATPPNLGFGVATGRTLESTLKILKEWGVPLPDVLITAVGSEINYGPELRPDIGWQNFIKYLWRRDAIESALDGVPGLTLQAKENQREFKLSYNVDPEKMPPMAKIRALLREQKLSAHLVYSRQAYLDILPLRGSKGGAIRYLAYKWGLPLRSFLVAGDSGNDREMLIGDTLGVIVANHSPELASLRGNEQIYFARAGYADGIAEGMAHYEFGTSLMETANDT